MKVTLEELSKNSPLYNDVHTLFTKGLFSFAPKTSEDQKASSRSLDSQCRYGLTADVQKNGVAGQEIVTIKFSYNPNIYREDNSLDKAATSKTTENFIKIMNGLLGVDLDHLSQNGGIKFTELKYDMRSGEVLNLQSKSGGGESIGVTIPCLLRFLELAEKENLSQRGILPVDGRWSKNADDEYRNFADEMITNALLKDDIRNNPFFNQPREDSSKEFSSDNAAIHIQPFKATSVADFSNNPFMEDIKEEDMHNNPFFVPTGDPKNTSQRRPQSKPVAPSSKKVDKTTAKDKHQTNER